MTDDEWRELAMMKPGSPVARRVERQTRGESEMRWWGGVPKASSCVVCVSGMNGCVGGNAVACAMKWSLPMGVA